METVEENVLPPVTPPVESQPIHKNILNQKGSFIIIIGIILIALIVGAAGYYLYANRKSNNVSNQTPSGISPTQPPANVDVSQNGTAAFVFISSNGKIGFLKEKAVDTSQWGGLTRIGELWTIENNQPKKLVDDAPVIDFVWAPDGNRLVYFKHIPKPQARLPFIKDVYASGGFAEGDVVYYDLLTKGKTVIGKFFRSDWQTPYDLPKWSPDSTEVLFNVESGLDKQGNTKMVLQRFNITTKQSSTTDNIQIRYVSSNLEKAIISENKEKSDTFSIINLKTKDTRVVSGLQTLAPGGSVYTYLWSPDNTNLAIVLNEQQADPNNYLTCVVYIFDTTQSSLNSVKKMDQKFDAGSCGYGNTQPSWSPDGHYVQLGNKLTSINPALYPVPNVTIDERHGGGPSGALNGVTWSPDSTMFADNINKKLSIYTLKTGKTIVIDEPTSNWVGVGYRAWFPDSSKLIYNINGNIISVKVDGTDKKVLAN